LHKSLLHKALAARQGPDGFRVATGPPGPGKSVVADVLAGDFDPSAPVGDDQFCGFLRRCSIPPWLPAAHDQNGVVIRSAASASGQLAAGGAYTVIYDGGIGPWFLPTFTTWMNLRPLHYAVLMPSEQCCVARVQQRVGHGFSDISATRHMYQQFAQADIDHRHLITDPPETAEDGSPHSRPRLPRVHLYTVGTNPTTQTDPSRDRRAVTGAG
jgi:hypothetical protein